MVNAMFRIEIQVTFISKLLNSCYQGFPFDHVNIRRSMFYLFIYLFTYIQFYTAPSFTSLEYRTAECI